MQTSDKSYSEGIKSLTYVPSILGKASGRGPRGPARNPLEPDPEEEGTWGCDDTGTQAATASPRGSEGPCTERVHPPDGRADPDAQTLTCPEPLAKMLVLPSDSDVTRVREVAGTEPKRTCPSLRSGKRGCCPPGILSSRGLCWPNTYSTDKRDVRTRGWIPAQATQPEAEICLPKRQLNDPEPHRDALSLHQSHFEALLL